MESLSANRFAPLYYLDRFCNSQSVGDSLHQRPA
jgi:hypothetical protein